MRTLCASVFVASCLSLVSCSKDSSSGSSPSVPGLSTVGSCNKSDEKLCFELYTTPLIEQYRTTCSQIDGTFNATSGCPTTGKVKGCQYSTQGVKAYTQWAYDATSAALVETVCNAPETPGTNGAPGATVQVVNP